MGWKHKSQQENNIRTFYFLSLSKTTFGPKPGWFSLVIRNIIIDLFGFILSKMGLYTPTQ